MKTDRLLLTSYLIASMFLLAGCNTQNEEYYTLEDFSSVEKIDTHVHMNVYSPILSEQAEQDNFRLLTVNVGSPSYPDIEEQQKVARNFLHQDNSRISYLTTIPMDDWNDPEVWQNNAIEYLKKSFENGAIGVKVWKNIGMEFKNIDGEFVMIDNPQFERVIDFIEENNKPLLGHIGEPHSCWQPLEEIPVKFIRDYYEGHPQYHMYLHPENPSYDEIIESRNALLDKNPRLSFIGAHLGSMESSIEMMSEHLDIYPNMVYDMAHRVTLLQYLTQQDREAVREFFIKYQNRFVYSTDIQHHVHSEPEAIRDLAKHTWLQDWEYFVTDNEMVNTEVNETSFRGLKLPKEVVDKIYRINAENVYPGI
ncbi:hypothetical protein BH23BAC3_BH23BAC3_02870 [soil metagenome]